MPRHTARMRALASLALLASLTATATEMVGQTPAAVQPSDKFLGNVWSPAQLPGFLDHWDQVTPENAGKWGPLEPRRGEYNWAPLDAAYALAKENGLPFRFHTVLWGNQQPAWMRTLPPAEQLMEIEKRFAAIAARYPEIDYIEIVNEPMNDPPRQRNDEDGASGNYYEALGGAGVSGWDWVLAAFRLGRQHFPASKLVLNEYNVTNREEATERYLSLIALLQAEKLIDVIGVQGHSFSTEAESAITKGNLDRLAATGLPIMVTEFDIDGPTDEIQLAEYQRIFPIFWDHPSVIGMTFWGWRPGMWRTRQQANLVREDGSPRPSMEWLMSYVKASREAAR